MDKYNFFRQGGPYPTEDQRLDTNLFYHNSIEIFDHFDDWKDIDKFYFIPLHLEMTYSCRWVAEMAPDPVWLGSFVTCIFNHPDLFVYKCPKCGQVVYPHRYTGSPLSGHVILEGTYRCDWAGYVDARGWRDRAVPLRDQLAEDQLRLGKFKLLHPKTSSSIQELLAI